MTDVNGRYSIPDDYLDVLVPKTEDEIAAEMTLERRVASVILQLQGSLNEIVDDVRSVAADAVVQHEKDLDWKASVIAKLESRLLAAQKVNDELTARGDELADHAGRLEKIAMARVEERDAETRRADCLSDALEAAERRGRREVSVERKLRFHVSGASFGLGVLVCFWLSLAGVL